MTSADKFPKGHGPEVVRLQKTIHGILITASIRTSTAVLYRADSDNPDKVRSWAVVKRGHNGRPSELAKEISEIRQNLLTAGWKESCLRTKGGAA